ncbi:DUF2116 family Zn-ribbon domain-containing protein [Paucimonas lemoignei]|uniref:DUF2116 family Zn-ribbon domain-containing protein n=1 Tax=Paucimonas lemoignei TaxID=29443 RepID=UPI00104A906F|nr:DUF2116 family Zn-ribbon domain-containing protein [Paucimonas lemoignei]
MGKQTFLGESTPLSFSVLHPSTCWYCDHHIPHGQRFCDKDCAEAFEDDDLAVERRALTRLHEPGIALV